MFFLTQLNSGYSTKSLYAPLLSLIRATCPANLTLLDLITRHVWWGQGAKSLSLRSLPISVSPRLPYAQKSSLAPCSETPPAYIPPLMWETKFHTHTKQQAKLYFRIYESTFLRNILKTKRKKVENSAHFKKKIWSFIQPTWYCWDSETSRMQWTDHTRKSDVVNKRCIQKIDEGTFWEAASFQRDADRNINK